MRSFWSILFIVIAILVGIRLLGFAFSLFFGLFRLLLPVAIIGFAIYGFTQFLKKR